MKLSLEDENRVVRAIANAERENRGEVRVHLEKKCRSTEPLARAQEVYERLGLRETRDDTAVLLYVATESRVCAVYCGAGLVAKPPAEFWKSITDKVARGFAKGAAADGLVAGLKHIGDVLRQHVPGDDAAGNEVPDAVTTGNV